MIRSDDQVLLKIHRHYEKDEAIKELFQRISELETEKGQLISEVADLNYRLTQPRPKIKMVIAKEYSENELLAKYKSELSVLTKKCSEQKEKIKKLTIDYAMAMIRVKQFEKKDKGLDLLKPNHEGLMNIKGMPDAVTYRVIRTENNCLIYYTAEGIKMGDKVLLDYRHRNRPLSDLIALGYIRIVLLADIEQVLS